MFFIFDWDGTLSNSTAKIVRCVQAAADEMGLDVPSDVEAKNIIGLGLSEAFQLLFPSLDTSLETELASRYSMHFVEQDRVPCDFFPNVIETLSTLKQQGYKLGVATGKSRRGLDRILENRNMGSFFHHSRCADETESKPSALMLEELLAEAGCTAADAVMVGDTEWDLRMASNIGMRSIAVSYGAHELDRLQACEPSLVIDDFKEILEWHF